MVTKRNIEWDNLMLKSMTGFASATGTLDGWSWTWELRSVNGKGLDLRLRVPDWIDGLEIGLRKALSAVAARGNVTLSLRITREEDAGGAFQINDRVLQSVLDAMAEQLAQSRSTDVAVTLQRNLAKIMKNADGFDETRIAQELALLAVKADITEEIDRLVAHVTAAQVLLAEAAPIGRKMDFLMQEFNREANTLCSKAQNADLTRIGLALKVLIDQMREQVQNVE
jgi:uncharacterized protein YicC (UPF0701 family)